ncbi:MAG: NAD(P)/FAD-dependent oxidoreductase [Rhizobiaceae bacterium]
MSAYQSPIAPGRSWYEDSCGERPTYRALEGDLDVDVAIVGGGFCGLSTALHLAQNGARVALLEANRLGDGASGRNGGQMGSGQRGDIFELEKQLGLQRSRALWDMAEDAKKNLLETTKTHSFDCDYQIGQLTPMHKRRYEAEAQAKVEHLQNKYNYAPISYLSQPEMAKKLGSSAYFGGIMDMGTGHIHPMKYVIGLAAVAARSGARIHEQTAVTRMQKRGKFALKTPMGTVSAERVVLALNGYHGDIRPELANHVLPIQSFIGATVPLEENTTVLPHMHAVDDSRFVVRYFRKSKDNRLLFGGREAYGKSRPGDIERAIRKQITEIYPHLAKTEITHAWGGNVAITLPRMPFVRELEPGLWTAGGFSGHGVMLSNHTGRMIAEHFVGKSEQIKLLKELKIPGFPGGTLLRNPLKVLALTWYAMLDRV